MEVEQWLVQFKRRQDALKRALTRSVDDGVEWGAVHAARIAPKDTTTLAQAISYRASGSNTNRRGMVFVRSLNNPKGGVTTKYGLVMHRTPYGKAKAKWSSGDPHFMFTTRKLMKKKFDTNVRYAIGGFLGKKVTR
jgi:hypothetical protein